MKRAEQFKIKMFSMHALISTITSLRSVNNINDMYVHQVPSVYFQRVISEANYYRKIK